MTNPAVRTVLADLRTRIGSLEGGAACRRGVLPFGVAEIDRRLPGGGLAFGGLHEVAGGGNGAVDGAAAALFAAGIAARTGGAVVWCVTRADLFAPALAQAGLPPGRVVHLETGDEADLLACFEDGLRHGGPSAVVGEVARLPMVASRRLMLAAETGGGIGIVLRRWSRQGQATDFGQPTASLTRWRVTASASAPLPVPGIGRSRWRLELVRCRAGESFEVEVEACDGQGRLALPAALADRSAPARRRFGGAAG